MGAGGAEGGADIPGFICTSLGFVSLSDCLVCCALPKSVTHPFLERSIHSWTSQRGAPLWGGRDKRVKRDKIKVQV